MWGLIAGALQGVVTGLVGPVFTYLGKRQDVTLEGFRAASADDRQTYAAFLDYQARIQALKLQAASWWGPRALYMVVGGAAALHTAAIFLDSTVKLGCGHYGCLGVPALPAAYAGYERLVVTSLFVASTIGPPLSAATAWLHRQGSPGSGRARP